MPEAPSSYFINITKLYLKVKGKKNVEIFRLFNPKNRALKYFDQTNGAKYPDLIKALEFISDTCNKLIRST